MVSRAAKQQGVPALETVNDEEYLVGLDKTDLTEGLLVEIKSSRDQVIDHFELCRTDEFGTK